MISQNFKTAYAKLNTKQKEAVDTIEGPVMVVAGPGTGKTTILTLRIANILLRTDTPPSGILALTFTEAGAKNMRSKLREIIGKRALEVPIHTFHGFASSIIAEFDEHFPHLSKSKQITEIEAEKILREILKQKKFSKLRPLGEPDFYIAKIIKTISDAKGEAWTPEMLESFARGEIERIKNDKNSISTRGQSKGQLKGEALKRIEKCERTILFAEVYEIYENKKKEERKIDFDDLIFELLEALRKDKLLLQLLQERYLYILLDEHQDNNDAQNLVVRTIADFFETPNLFVVGDEKQAIYRFQGASVENFLSFQKIWSTMKVIPLSLNYRSHQNILDASFKMIEQNYEGREHQNLRLKLKSDVKGKKPLDLVISPNPETEGAYLTEQLRQIIKKEKEASIAVIVRKNSEVSKIFYMLESADIPASCERGANIFSHPVGVVYFSLLEFLANPTNLESLAETLVLGLWQLDFARQAKLIKLARDGDLTGIIKELPQISKLQKEIGKTGALEFLHLAAEISGFIEIIGDDPLRVEVWRGIVALAEDLARSEEIENPKNLIGALLDYKKTAERRIIKINTGEVDAQVTVMTAHGSKGLEFDYVFLPYVTEESWMRKNHGSYFILPKEKESGDDVRDERRLFYVSLTRAKKHISLSYHRSDELGKTKTPLRFIDELDQKLINEIILDKTIKPEAKTNLAKTKERQNKEHSEYTKRVLIENGLSVTALNHFLECPNKFFYKSILKLPEAPTASSEGGTAMHEAMANVWKMGGGKKEKEITSVINTSVKNYFKHSFLPLHEKEAVLDELITNAPKVAKALLEHFNQAGKVLTESWVETYFRDIRLHGKLDAILDQGDKILVYDYKTTEVKSIANIKGETESSEGNYFRQLVFYKLLLEDPERSRRVEKVVEPALVFIKPDKAGRCPTIFLPIEKEDVEKVKSEIAMLLKSVWSGESLNQTCPNPDCKYCNFRKL